MNAFEFSSVGRVIFGRGKVAQLGELARVLGGVALFIHNGDDPGRGGPVDRAAASLASAGVNVCFHRQRGEPTISDVDAALATAREQNCDVLIGLGGGSAIDAAKATAGLLTNGGQCLDYMEVIGKGRKISLPAAPWIAVPTTAGTGAEVTKNAVIGSPERKFKASIRSEHLLARVALIDPELQVGVPPDVTAASGMDALCQCIEAHTSLGANEMTQSLSLRGMALAAGALKHVIEDGKNLDLREDMALAALLSGMSLANAGLGAVHGFAAPLGANFPIPHGVICGVLLPWVVEANIHALRREQSDWLHNYPDVGRSCESNPTIPYEEAIERAISFLRQLVADLKLPRLATFGLRQEHIPEMVALAKKTSSMRYNPVLLADDVLANILLKAL